MSMSFSFSTSGLRDQAVENIRTQAKNQLAGKGGMERSLLVTARDAVCEHIKQNAAAEDSVTVSASFSASAIVTKPQTEPVVEDAVELKK